MSNPSTDKIQRFFPQWPPLPYGKDNPQDLRILPLLRERLSDETPPTPDNSAPDIWRPAGWMLLQTYDFAKEAPKEAFPPPNNGFSAQDAYDWVDRVIVYYQEHLSGQRRYFGWEYREPFQNALSLVYDLKRRDKTFPHFKTFVNHEDADGPEIVVALNGLVHVRNWLDRLKRRVSSKERAINKNAGKTAEPVLSRNPFDRLKVNLADFKVSLDGDRDRLPEEQVVFLHFLMQAKGDWISGPEMKHPLLPVPTISRVFKRLPKHYRVLIESAPGKGYRLNKAAFLLS